MNILIYESYHLPSHPQHTSNQNAENITTLSFLDRICRFLIGCASLILMFPRFQENNHDIEGESKIWELAITTSSFENCVDLTAWIY